MARSRPPSRAKPRPSAAPARRGRKKGAPPVRTDAILSACAQVFIRQGYADTSLRELIAAAGVSTTAFYARFASRDAVLEAIAQELLGAIATEGAARLSAVASVEEGFSTGIEVLRATVAGKRALVRLVLGEAGATDRVRKALGVALANLAELLEALLSPWVTRGVLSKADARALSWVLVGALKIQLERWALFENIDDDELTKALHETAEALLPLVRKRAR